MKLHVIGSSSAGNAYAFEAENQTLLLEAGVRFTEVKKALGFDLSKIVGCCITHEHGDHAKYASQVMAAGIDVFTSVGTIKATGLESHHWCPVLHGKRYQVGDFKVTPFTVKHDCAEPFGFYISHPEMGNCLFMTDCYYVANTFPNLNQLLVEANYADDIITERLNAGKIHPSIATRVRSSHMEIETLKSMLQANDLKAVNNIVLIHLSDGNSDAARFQREIHDLTGKTVMIADKGMTLPFNKHPF